MGSENEYLIDKKLILSLKKGDVNAFKKVFILYERRLYRFVFSYTKSEYISEEIIQEVFIKIWERRKSIKLSGSFHSFIFTLTRNKTLNYLRDASKRESVKKELWNNLTKHNDDIENDLIYSEYQDIVEDIVQTLSQTERSVYRLSVEKGKANREIAALLGIHEKTVRNCLYKAKSSIKTQLAPYI